MYFFSAFVIIVVTSEFHCFDQYLSCKNYRKISLRVIKKKSKSVSHLVVSHSLQPHGEPLLSMEFSRQEYWSGLPFPPPGDLPNPVIKSGSLALPADSLPSEPPVYLPNSRRSENIFLFLLHINSDLAMNEFLFTLFFLETL